MEDVHVPREEVNGCHKPTGLLCPGMDKTCEVNPQTFEVAIHFDRCCMMNLGCFGLKNKKDISLFVMACIYAHFFI